MIKSVKCQQMQGVRTKIQKLWQVSGGLQGLKRKPLLQNLIWFGHKNVYFLKCKYWKLEYNQTWVYSKDSD